GGGGAGPGSAEKAGGGGGRGWGAPRPPPATSSPPPTWSWCWPRTMTPPGNLPWAGAAGSARPRVFGGPAGASRPVSCSPPFCSPTRRQRPKCNSFNQTSSNTTLPPAHERALLIFCPTPFWGYYLPRESSATPRWTWMGLEGIGGVGGTPPGRKRAGFLAPQHCKQSIRGLVGCRTHILSCQGSPPSTDSRRSAALDQQHPILLVRGAQLFA